MALAALRTFAVPSAIACAAFLLTPRAHADVSSWFSVSGGTFVAHPDDEPDFYPSLLLQTGMGTAPGKLFSVGGVFEVEPSFGYATDLGLKLRTASRGFVDGGFGLAVDLGGYQRLAQSSTGVGARLVLGAPWGVVLTAGGGAGTQDHTHASLVLGVDLARLTVNRRTGQNWWRNTLPARRSP
jgi:hypothetical protein